MNKNVKDIDAQESAESTDGVESTEGTESAMRDLSARRIVGFACNQGFLFFLLIRGIDTTVLDFDMQQIGQIALFGSLVIGLLLVRVLGSQRIGKLLARPLLYIYAVIAAVGSLLVHFLHQGNTGLVVAQGALTGIPCALLLAAWGRAFGLPSIKNSVAEVFLGSLTGALLCFLFLLRDASDITLFVTRILPLASVVNIVIPSAHQYSNQAEESDEPGKVRRLSVRMLVGTFLFGAAGGLAQFYGSIAGTTDHYLLALILFGAYLVGCLTLILSEGFGRGAALNKAYRLAIFLMMIGVLLAPAASFIQSTILGQSFILAGYLGVQTVLIALFIVMARLSGVDCALEFSRGLFVLFLGEFIGALVTACVDTASLVEFSAFSSMFALLNVQSLIVALAGALVLLGYIFFFTERDFDALSQMVTGIDTLEQICERLVKQYGLSAREGEILEYALRGRTNERIAQELVIAKSTVDTHLRRIYTKCDVHSRQELLDLAEDR